MTKEGDELRRLVLVGVAGAAGGRRLLRLPRQLPDPLPGQLLPLVLRFVSLFTFPFLSWKFGRFLDPCQNCFEPLPTELWDGYAKLLPVNFDLLRVL